MSRLIDADQLIQEFENNIATYESNEFEEGTNTGIRWCTEDVANAPTVDAVQVIRCKDCKHYFTGQCCHPIVYYHGAKALMVMPDDYCSKAVREDI